MTRTSGEKTNVAHGFADPSTEIGTLNMVGKLTILIPTDQISCLIFNHYNGGTMLGKAMARTDLEVVLSQLVVPTTKQLNTALGKG